MSLANKMLTIHQRWAKTTPIYLTNMYELKKSSVWYIVVFLFPLQRAKIPNSYSIRNNGQINTTDFPITRYYLILNIEKLTITWPNFTYRVGPRFAFHTTFSRSWFDRHYILLNDASVTASSFIVWERKNQKEKRQNYKHAIHARVIF